MEHRTFWDEELRAFPTGGRGAAVWVVRREGHDQTAPLRLLLAWDCGTAGRESMAARDRKSTRLNSSHQSTSRMPSSA